MGQLGKIYPNLNSILQEIGEKNLQSCYSSEEMVAAASSNIDFSETKI